MSEVNVFNKKIRMNNSIYSVSYKFRLQEGLCYRCKKQRLVFKPEIIFISNGKSLPLICESPRAQKIKKELLKRINPKCEDCSEKQKIKLKANKEVYHEQS